MFRIFEVDIVTIIGCLTSKRGIRYAVVNPPPDLSQDAHGNLCLQSHDVEARVDLYSTVELLDAVEGYLRRSGVAKEAIYAIRAQAQSDPQLTPFDALIQFGPFRESEAVLAQCNRKVLRHEGLEEKVWCLFQSGGVGSPLGDPLRAMWDTHSELTFNEMQAYCSVALGRGIGNLKASGEFPLLCDYWQAWLKMQGLPESLTQRVLAIASERGECTFQQVMDRINSALRARSVQASGAFKMAGGSFVSFDTLERECRNSLGSILPRRPLRSMWRNVMEV